MRRALILPALLAACANAPAPAPAPEPVAARAEPELVIAFTTPAEHARKLTEDLAARCWLDGVVRGAQLFVMPYTGNIKIVGETEALLVGDFLTPVDGKARLRLTGPVITDPAKVAKIEKSVEIAVTTGETACPIAEG